VGHAATDFQQVKSAESTGKMPVPQSWDGLRVGVGKRAGVAGFPLAAWFACVPFKNFEITQPGDGPLEATVASRIIF